MNLARRLGRVSASLEPAARARDFVSLARVIALSKGGHWRLAEVAREAGLSSAVLEVLDAPTKVYDFSQRLKAAAATGSTSDSTWAAPLAAYEVLANAFLESLQNFGAFDRLLGSMRQVPIRTRVGASTAAASGSAVGQGMVKSISKLSLAGGMVDERKAVAILVLTEELARFGATAAGNLFAAELSNAVAVATDTEFVSVLTAGAPSIGSSGVTAEHVRNDLRGLLSLITTSARSALFLLMTSAVAKTLSILHTSAGDSAFPGMTPGGGTIGGIEAVVSDGVPSATMVLVDAQQVAAASETIQLEAAREAAVQMDSAPDSPPSGTTNFLSLWQTNHVGLRAERFFGATKLTSSGAAVLTGANYSGDSPGP